MAAHASHGTVGISRKEALLQAAKELFGEYGYAETTFKKISERANVALGLLTHHYGNKEKLFLAAGLDVLENFLGVLRAACGASADGRRGVLAYCRAYLEFSVDPRSNWLVLVRCSPFSDMKTTVDREVMTEKFAEVLVVLEQQIERGQRDGSVRPLDVHNVSQVILSLMVGANRTRVLTPYASSGLYAAVLDVVDRAVSA